MVVRVVPISLPIAPSEISEWWRRIQAMPSGLSWRFETGVDDARYASMALRWRDEGAQIVGGCCGANAAYIRALARGLAQG